MKSRLKFIITLGVCALVIAGLFFISTKLSLTGNAITGSAVKETKEAESLAKCLSDKGAKMFGAYWCGHCQNQKLAFGESFKYIDYTECDPKGENANPSACSSAGIKGYPTWQINGVLYSGEKTFEELKLLSGC
jgi:hypothetical protein